LKIAAQTASDVRAVTFFEQMLELGEDPFRALDLQVFREFEGGLKPPLFGTDAHGRL
jgi:hypothetical protein